MSKGHMLKRPFVTQALFQHRDVYLYLSTMLLGIVLSGCASEPQEIPLVTPQNQAHQLNERHEQTLFDVYQQWEGVPYRWGGNTQSGVDCSAFVQIAFQDAWQISLPRTTKNQSNTGKKINRKDAHYGDLVFFRINSTLEHVGVYIGNQRFMHASSSKGVIISRLDNPYWASKFWQFRRISRPYTVR